MSISRIPVSLIVSRIEALIASTASDDCKRLHLQALATAEWYDRYSGRVEENYRLPKTDAAREQLASTIGGDERKLVLAIDTMGIPELAKLPAVRMLRQDLGRTIY